MRLCVRLSHIERRLVRVKEAWDTTSIPRLWMQRRSRVSEAVRSLSKARVGCIHTANAFLRGKGKVSRDSRVTRCSNSSGKFRRCAHRLQPGRLSDVDRNALERETDHPRKDPGSRSQGRQTQRCYVAERPEEERIMSVHLSPSEHHKHLMSQAVPSLR